MSGRLQDKTVLITGGSEGIGRACARLFAREGARLLLVSRRREALERVAAELAPAPAAVFAADLADGEARRLLCGRITREYPSIDVLINNAGVGLYAPSYEADPEKVRYLLELNFHAPVDLSSRLLPKIPAGGSIVNVSSIAGKVPLPWLSLYSAAKYALNAYSDALRMEIHGSGIHVMTVCPGYVGTDFGKHVLHGAIPEKVAGQRRFKISAEKCAEEILEGVVRRKRTVVTPRIGWLLVAAARLFPAVVYDRMARMQPRRGRRPWEPQDSECMKN